MIMNNTGMLNNITMVDEDNWEVINPDTDIWRGELPYKSGMTFPTPEIKERASISKTNELIYTNNIEQIYGDIISVFPEIEPMYGMQIRELVTNLPMYKNAVSNWVGLIAGDEVIIDYNDGTDSDDKVSDIVNKSNFNLTIQNEVRRRFMDVVSAYRVDMDLLNKPKITNIDTKNLICFVNEDINSFIEVNVVFSIYNNDGVKYIDFVEYHYDGLIRKQLIRIMMAL